MGEIPVIDFAPCSMDFDVVAEEDKRSVGEKIYEAMATVGFLYLKNTGITNEEIKEMRDKTKGFFNLDIREKGKYRLNDRFHGYVGNQQERLNAKRPPDLKEFFDVMGSDLFSADTPWPDEKVNGFSAVTKQFSERCKLLSLRLLEVIAIGMDMKDRGLFMRNHSRMNCSENYSSLRFLCYRPLSESYEVKPEQIRLGEHSDYGTLTLVFQDEVGGLQVQRYDGEYIDATPKPDTIIVNMGDCVEYWTQGRLKATKHRILLPRMRTDRWSMVYFCKANNDTVLTEIEYGPNHRNYRQNNMSQVFEPITAGELNERRYGATFIQ